jgi:ClpP class serine protease
MTAKRVIGIGLVDEIGDFQDTLEVAVVAAGCNPAPKWMRPNRSFTQRMFARSSIGRQAGGLSVLDGLQRIMSGEIFYLEPGHISGGDYGLSSQE